MNLRFLVTVFAAVCLVVNPTQAADQPQWGAAWSRNMVSAEHGLPESFDPATGRNIKWTAKIGTETHSTPVVAGGRVYIGTNNGEPRDPKHEGDRGVLMCFDERDGKFLWQLVVPKRSEDPYFDWPKTGIASPATVEGDRVYVVNNRGEVICLDAHGMSNGNDGPFRDEGAHMTSPDGSGPPRKPQAGLDIQPETLRPPADGKVLTPGPLDADVIWIFDLVSGAGIWPHDGAHSSVLVHGDFLYLNTGTGVDNTHKRIRATNAPSLVVLDKLTGRLLARDDEHIAPAIFHAAWSAPSLGVVNGRTMIFHAGANGVLYAFEPLASRPPPGVVMKLEKIFQFDTDPRAPKENVHSFNQNKLEGPSIMHGMPVFLDRRIFLAGGGDLWWGKNEAWLKCVDATGAGDITGKAEVWSYPMTPHTMSTPAVSDGLVYVSDTGRNVHCVDARTGSALWTHECRGLFWASPMVADGKVFIGSRRGDFWVFAAGREKKILGSLELGSPVTATAVAANGVLYVATMKQLFAIAAGK
ncbi:MAG: PQQ-binding-like beta-propeller repeat protein [Limisphaerales bacterium]